jgi:hypothetical protein
MLNQAITQCLGYGFGYLFCITWTNALTTLDLLGHDEEIATKYFWVRQTQSAPVFVLACVGMMILNCTYLFLHS